MSLYYKLICKNIGVGTSLNWLSLVHQLYIYVGPMVIGNSCHPIPQHFTVGLDWIQINISMRHYWIFMIRLLLPRVVSMVLGHVIQVYLYPHITVEICGEVCELI